ncbi:hypothetical protein CBW18_05750 [Pedobacter sp. AJM]|nr:hypothetical protein CBW18_05750 [Pedobacter sp. AJM]
MIVQLGVLIHGRAREILRSLFLFFQLSKNGRFLIIQKWAKQFIEEAIGIDFKMINSLVKLIVISFYDTAFPPYCLTNSQNQLSLRNAHKSSNFRGLTYIRKHHIMVVSFFFDNKILLVKTLRLNQYQFENYFLSP